jgi:hypothetical protein
MQVWCFGEEGYAQPRLTLFTQVICFPKKRVLQVRWAFGEQMARFWNVAEATLEHFCSMTQCEQIAFTSPRIAWERVLRSRAGRFDGIVWTRDVDVKRTH